ncbi:hypothetical protein AGOR_G00133040 [Albula goreensis]|uniref:Uncharacterized protein n=1 Tax=Albula goreensis TaxID=1534307 RepID=A0A8T3D9Z8_9TELE|nr:hypothetical protein AGOR_G00133040 [Albula goreensis]
MERLEPLDLQDLLGLLEREESRASLAPLVSRVCLDLLAPLVREESLVTRVSLEKAELLVLLDPEVSAVSQEREVVPDLRVCRDPVVFPELQEQTDPRELLDQAAAQVPRDPLAFRACPERGAPPESQDPRVTEVTMARKDLRELLAKMAQEV